MARFLRIYAANQCTADKVRSALRTLFALATTRRVPGLDGRMQELPRNQCLIFLDIKKAHFWADARRRIRGGVTN